MKSSDGINAIIWPLSLLLIIGVCTRSCVEAIPLAATSTGALDQSAEVEISKAKLLYYGLLDTSGSDDTFARNKRKPFSVVAQLSHKSLQSSTAAENRLPEKSGEAAKSAEISQVPFVNLDLVPPKEELASVTLGSRFGEEDDEPAEHRSTSQELTSTTPEETHTTQEQTSATQEQTSTTQEQTLTTQEQISATQGLPSTTQEQTSATQGLPSATQGLPSTTQELTSATQEQTSTTQEQTSTTQEQTSTTQEQTSTTQKHKSTTQELTQTQILTTQTTLAEVSAKVEEVSREALPTSASLADNTLEANLPESREETVATRALTGPTSATLADNRIESTAPLLTPTESSDDLLTTASQKFSFDTPCLSPECIHSASKMLNRMNFSADPCTDFYEFACGGFIANTPVEPTTTSINIFSIINDKLLEQIRDMLSEPIDEETDMMPIKIIKNLYAGCMNQELIEERGEKPLFDMLQHLGGWPVLVGERWDGSHWTWTDTVARMKMLGVGFDQIVGVSVLNDFQNSSKRIIYVDQSTFELERDFLINGWNESNVLALYNYIKDVGLALKGNKNLVEKEAREVVNFEIALAKISASKESRRDLEQLYNPITIRALQLQHPYINWLEFLNLLLPQGVRVDENQTVSVADKEFFEQLGPLVAATPKRVIANYLLWRAVDGAIEYLTSKLRAIEIQYRMKVEGKEQRDAQWKECVMFIAPEFKIAVGAEYIRKYFQESSKAVAVEMVSDIKMSFEEIINTRDWMDETTKRLALEKLKSMSVNIAYPSELMDDAVITEYYKGLHVKKEEFFESYLRAFAWHADKSLDRLHEPVNKTDWRDLAYVAVVNAFYHPILNYIMFPAGILQDHFFDKDRPKFMNYAAIGFVIGHEITHGFDDMGNQFDIDGNLKQWWANDTLEAYSARANCMVEQFNNFVDPEVNLNLNGVNTQGENIADAGGLKEAYHAYQKWVEKHGEEKVLPGLNYTANQLFWISAAQTWCTVYRPGTLKYTIVSDSHSPGRFRVLGPFMNSQDFPLDFDCPVGSPMNPEHKCEVW